MYESWHTLASKSLGSVDGRTVQVVSKWNGRMKAEEIEEWLNTNGDDRIFPNIEGEERKRLCDRAVDMIGKGYEFRTFRSLNDRMTYMKFYNVIEQIPCWFDADASKGYEGGASLVKRPRVEMTLRAKFGDHGYYAIMLYVMKHWREMYKARTRILVNSLEYVEKFGERE